MEGEVRAETDKKIPFGLRSTNVVAFSDESKRIYCAASRFSAKRRKPSHRAANTGSGARRGEARAKEEGGGGGDHFSFLR